MPRVVCFCVIFGNVLDGNPYDFDCHQSDFVESDYGITFAEHDVSVINIESVAVIDCEWDINEIA